MSFSKNKIYIILLVFIFSAMPVFVQGFGQNKVQYNAFDWHYLQSEHFDVYFYPGGYDIAIFTANIAESSYVSLENDFQYELSDRVSIILYKSHNDFQQTNVVDSYMGEGVGGVTELYKNRVVVPFEGSFSQLRHVIHYELTHAVMFDMLYGGSIQSLVSGQVVPVPLWFAEGLAEYFSLRWDTRSDMIIRDATISGYLPPIEYLNYYLPYQGGQSVFRYIAEKYGHDKISEILHKVKGSFRFEGAFRSALGIKLEELSENWLKQMRKEYWPDIADRKETKEIARAITDHKKDENYLNISPALSPNGGKLLFLSDRDDRQSIYLMDILENKIIKKIIKGQTSSEFEELHWLSPGMGWSPDGKNVTFTAKAGDQDALYLYEIESENTKQYKFDLDGLFSSAWSPKGDEIAFIGIKNGESDIYVFNIKTEELTNITNDVFADSYPRWSTDGEKIAFVSERGEYINKEDIPDKFNMSGHDFNNSDIYVINRDGGSLIRITDTENSESDPVFSPDGTKLMYVSDWTGISNIYLHDLETGQSFPVTNLLTGAFQLSVDKDGKTLAFASYFEGGWDIFTIKNPFELKKVEAANTGFFEKLDKIKQTETPVKPKETVVENDTLKKQIRMRKVSDFSRYVFADMDRDTQVKKVDVTLDKDDYKVEDGHYKVRNYRVKFSPDIVNGTAAYNTLWGFQAYTQLAFSDVLGNHKIFLGTNLVFDLRNSYLTLQYWYLPKRIDYGFSVYHYADSYISYTSGLMRFRNYGLSAIASRPFSKFTRVDFNLNWLNVDMEYLQIDVPVKSVRSILPSVQFVHDNAEWDWAHGFTGPRGGFRGAVSVTCSPKYSSKSPEFTSVKTDIRKYIKLTDSYSLALRLTGGASRGKNPQQFFLGGVSNWLNRKFNGDIRIGSIEDVYFSEFVTPLRGARYYECDGNNFILTNFEFRFPLIPYMQLGFPPIRLGNIQGLFFTDVGSAWFSHETFKGIKDDRLNDIIAGYGMGARIYFMGFLLKYDVAWKYDLKSSAKPLHYLSLGIDF